MSKIAVFYGSSTGMTEELAQRIAKVFDCEDACFDIASTSVEEVLNYDILLLGSSTWGIGDLQDDWEEFLPQLKEQNLEGKIVALFGCGDADSYPDSFCEALSIIKEALEGTSCRFVGAYEPDEYSYDVTRSEEDGKLIGLCIDEVNQSDLTEQRLDHWASLVKSAI